MKSEYKYSFLEAKTKLEALCAYQERCSFELEQKMILWGIDFEDRNRLLAHLISNNFLNEQRFAEAYVSGKTNIKKWGRIKIRQHLKQKRVSDYSIQHALNTIDDEVYINHLQFLTERKLEALKSEKDSFKKTAKVYRYLASKGYETELIREVISEK